MSIINLLMPIARRVRTFSSKFYFLKRNVIELNNMEELKKIMGWKDNPTLNDPWLNECSTFLDANERRMRDAESICVVCKNTNPSTIVEIGTSYGRTTTHIADNAPDASIHTLNILPEGIESGEAGKVVTHALTKNEIGKLYKERDLPNITQIYENSLTWEPNMKEVDIAFIDGCHDKEFVISDTLKVINKMKKGSFVMWHDFNLDLINRCDWIHDVCSAVERLYVLGVIKGPVYHIKDSWVCIYEVQ